MKRFLSWVIGFPVALLLILFALANRHFVVVSLDPLWREDPWASVSVPLWLVVFLAILLGLIAGWIGAWFNQGRWRRAAREARKELATERSKAVRLSP